MICSRSNHFQLLCYPLFISTYLSTMNTITRTFNQITKLRKMSTSPALKKYFLLNYKYVDNVVEKRAPFRSKHLNLAKKYKDNGKLLMGGAFADPVDGAAIVFQVDEKREVEEFVENDPYVTGGIVTSWVVREWTVVV